MAITGLVSDLRFAWRTLRHQPWSSAAIVVTLALGIGAATAVYAVFNYAVFRPVPGIDETDLVSLLVRPDPASRFMMSMSHEHLRSVRAAPAFVGVAGYLETSVPVRFEPTDAPELQQVVSVSLDYFDILRVRPRLGRLFAPEEYEQQRATTAVISERVWARRYASDPNVIGKELRLFNSSFTIIGVADDFRGLDRLAPDDLWVPYGSRALLERDPNLRHQFMIGRLVTGTSLAAARTQAAAAVLAVGEIKGRVYVGDDYRNATMASYTAVVYPGISDGIGLIRERLMNLYRIMFAGVLALLLLGCANAASLLISRNLRRRHDLAVKAALGAAPGRVLRELMVEGATLSAAAAGLGLALAFALAAVFRADRLSTYSGSLEDLQMDWRVAAFAIAAAITTIALASGMPSAMASRYRPARGLEAGGRGSTAGGRFRTLLTGVQIALSTTLVSGAAVLSVTIYRLHMAPAGFDTNRVVTFCVAGDLLGYDTAQSERLLHDVEDRLAATPGIEAVGYAWVGHVRSLSFDDVRRPDQPATANRRGNHRAVSSAYFEALGLRPTSGRVFTVTEARRSPAPPIVILSEALARDLFGASSPLGQQLLIDQQTPIVAEVIGVVPNTISAAFPEPSGPAFYTPVSDFLPYGWFHARTPLPTEAVASLVRAVVREIDPDVPVIELQRVSDDLRDRTAQPRLLAKLALILAIIAFGLAVAGTYALVTCRVAERTRELGIRIALGAPLIWLAGSELASALLTSAMGVLGGVALYAYTSQWLASRLYGVSALNPAILSGVAGTLVIAATLAAWLPAWRTTRIDPTVSLRSE